MPSTDNSPGAAPMSVGQMRTLCQPLVLAVLLGLCACGAGTPAGPGASPPQTTSEPDAAAPGVPPRVPDAGSVTPPAPVADAATGAPDQAAPPPATGGAQVVVEAGDS